MIAFFSYEYTDLYSSSDFSGWPGLASRYIPVYSETCIKEL